MEKQDYDDKPTASALAKSALEQGKGDPRRARQILNDRFDDQPELLEQVIDELISTAVRSYVSIELHNKRAKMIADAKRQKIPDITGLRAMARHRRESLYNYWLTKSGKRLGDATAQELIEEANMHRMHAERNAIKAQWFAKLAEAVGDSIVREKFKEEDIRKLWEESGGGN